MATYYINAWIEVNEEQAKELNMHLSGKDTSDLYCQIAEHLDSINEIVPFYWDNLVPEIDEDNMFELCANKSLSEIKNMPEGSDMQAQAIRYYLSRLLMNYTEDNPLEDVNICIEEDSCGVSSLEMPWITKIYQAECEGCIYVWLDTTNNWSDIDEFDTKTQLTILECLVNDL